MGDSPRKVVQIFQPEYVIEGDHLRIQAGPGSHAGFILIAGAPFGKPIVPYGPFVKNTEDEIRQALFELRNGTFVKS